MWYAAAIDGISGFDPFDMLGQVDNLKECVEQESGHPWMDHELGEVANVI